MKTFDQIKKLKESRRGGLALGELQEASLMSTYEAQERQQNSFIEAIRNSYGVDLLAEKNGKKTFDFESPYFSWKNYREAAYKVAHRKMQEAQAENTFGQLLRAGINMVANNWYLLVETSKEQVGAMTVTTKAVEPYAPLHRGGVPRRVMRGTVFPEVRVMGLDIQIMNEKFGAIEAFERELFDDDQTGQIAQRAKDMGANMAILEDAWFFQRFIGTAGSYGGDVIPASQTKPSNEATWPFTSSGLVGGGINRPSSYGTFSSGLVQAADIGLFNMLDLLGNKMVVNPNTLVTGSDNRFTSRTLLNSQWYPSTAAMVAGGSGGGATNLGTTFAQNVLQGAYNLVSNRFFPNKAWALGEAGKGIVFQRRDPLEIIQENPQSGMAFSQDVFRFRSRSRWEPDWVDPRFWWLGNDGTV